MAETLTSLSALGPWLAFGGLAVLALLALVLSRRARRRGSHALAAGHRLAVVDQVPIDQTRRLVLIQRDEVQHLVILGGGSDFLVESGIRAGEVRLHAPEPAPHAHHEHGHHDHGHHEHAPHHRPVFLDEPRREPPAAESAREPEPLREAAPLREPAPRAAERPAPAREPGALFRPAAPRRAAPVAPPAEEPAPVAMPEPRLDIDPVTPPRPVTEPAVRPRAPLRPEPRTEPRLDSAAPDKPEGGPRVAVKLDPFFAGMVEQLEETLRRPTGNGETARSAQVTVATATVSASAPARPVPDMKTVEAVAPAAPKDEPKLLNVAAAKPVGTPPAVTIPAASPADTPKPSPEGRADAPIPVLPTDILPPETSDAAPKAASPDVLAPTAQDRPAAPGDDPFEIEMASLLGRNRRP
ncbi:flagellar biosynthetic protein FliO [Ancylobacter radicis]|uniref:Flagellar biosynthetic protein FliO n=1 Tax=Ancylobacter radicis TaxID=2836179 RepID=A0ABS5R1Z2_9HYPH|nr:flagellar biosynthetic protein FliO [Ancylobacter radicis]MBS9475688.1 flagellar biosynthetic protein FliO [Ancylobacter radicis]